MHSVNTQTSIRMTIKLIMAMREETQGSLARSIGLSTTTVNAKQIGRSSWTLNDLDALAKHWEVSVIDLLKGAPHALVLMKADSEFDISSAERAVARILEKSA